MRVYIYIYIYTYIHVWYKVQSPSPPLPLGWVSRIPWNGPMDNSACQPTSRRPSCQSGCRADYDTATFETLAARMRSRGWTSWLWRAWSRVGRSPTYPRFRSSYWILCVLNCTREHLIFLQFKRTSLGPTYYWLYVPYVDNNTASATVFPLGSYTGWTYDMLSLRPSLSLSLYIYIYIYIYISIYDE